MKNNLLERKLLAIQDLMTRLKPLVAVCGEFKKLNIRNSAFYHIDTQYF